MTGPYDPNSEEEQEAMTRASDLVLWELQMRDKEEDN